jgi:hypothetical protein
VHTWPDMGRQPCTFTFGVVETPKIHSAGAYQVGKEQGAKVSGLCRRQQFSILLVRELASERARALPFFKAVPPLPLPLSPFFPSIQPFGSSLLLRNFSVALDVARDILHSFWNSLNYRTTVPSPQSLLVDRVNCAASHSRTFSLTFTKQTLSTSRLNSLRYRQLLPSLKDIRQYAFLNYLQPGHCGLLFAGQGSLCWSCREERPVCGYRRRYCYPGDDRLRLRYFFLDWSTR